MLNPNDSPKVLQAVSCSPSCTSHVLLMIGCDNLYCSQAAQLFWFSALHQFYVSLVFVHLCVSSGCYILPYLLRRSECSSILFLLLWKCHIHVNCVPNLIFSLGIHSTFWPSQACQGRRSFSFFCLAMTSVLGRYHVTFLYWFIHLSAPAHCIG